MSTENVSNDNVPSSNAPKPAFSRCRGNPNEGTTFVRQVKAHINDFINSSMHEHKNCFQNGIKKMFGKSKVVAERNSETKEVESSLPLRTT